MKVPCVYMLASRRDGILYIGVSSDLAQRMLQHVNETFEGFSKKHGLKTLVYYETHVSMVDAIQRETRLKGWKRAWKVRLIEGFNPEWLNLFDPETLEIASGPADLAREHGGRLPFGDLRGFRPAPE
jgi:putative endonuclease